MQFQGCLLFNGKVLNIINIHDIHVTEEKSIINLFHIEQSRKEEQ